MAKFEERRSEQDKESAQAEDRVQKEAQKKSGRTIRSQTIYCNKIPLTPAHSVSPDQDLARNLPSMSSSNSWETYYRDVVTINGPAHQCVDKEEKKVVPEDGASIRMSPTHKITNAPNILTLAHDGTLPKVDVVINYAQSDSFRKDLQSFQAVQVELDDVLTKDNDGKFDVPQQLGQRRTGPPTTMAEEAVEEVFMEQGVVGPSTTIEYETRARLLPLKDDKSAIMSSLNSQPSDVATHPGSIPQRVDYVAFDIKRHNEEPTIYSIVGTETGRDRHSVPKSQHYCQPFTRPTLYPSARSYNAVCYKQVTYSDKGEGIDELTE